MNTENTTATQAARADWKRVEPDALLRLVSALTACCRETDRQIIRALMPKIVCPRDAWKSRDGRALPSPTGDLEDALWLARTLHPEAAITLTIDRAGRCRAIVGVPVVSFDYGGPTLALALTRAVLAIAAER